MGFETYLNIYTVSISSEPGYQELKACEIRIYRRKFNPVTVSFLRGSVSFDARMIKISFKFQLLKFECTRVIYIYMCVCVCVYLDHLFLR